MRSRTDAHPVTGWLLIAACVGFWDVLNARSLTSYARAHRRPTAAVALVLAGHLVGVLPARVDPFTYLARWVRPT